MGAGSPPVPHVRPQEKKGPLVLPNQFKGACALPVVGAVTTSRVNPCTQIGQIVVKSSSEGFTFNIPLYVSGSQGCDVFNARFCPAWAVSIVKTAGEASCDLSMDVLTLDLPESLRLNAETPTQIKVGGELDSRAKKHTTAALRLDFGVAVLSSASEDSEDRKFFGFWFLWFRGPSQAMPQRSSKAKKIISEPESLRTIQQGRAREIQFWIAPNASKPHHHHRPRRLGSRHPGLSWPCWFGSARCVHAADSLWDFGPLAPVPA